ncbi:MAG: hypothetical protein XU11_C0016G0005 [Candidatus Dadabacteria bacterium CSP1-2]|jgi:hypothetical protein|nr:MAG: hypothetical protein XU11_C0016G0005 [Candidatus Dadabacteria bacterium CSP1-2]
MIKKFFLNLKESMEKHARHLRRGKIFLPQYLGRGKLEKAFNPVAHSLARALNLRIGRQIPNTFCPCYEIGGNQRVDFVFYERRQGNNIPLFFLELESLDGSQLCHFGEHEGIRGQDNINKQWYYYGTIGNYYTLKQKVPRYFVWLLSIPDRLVDHYQIWDTNQEYQFFHSSLRGLVYQNPYRFYDYLIKTSAKTFLETKQEFKDPKTKRWVRKRLVEFQDVCELVFITCTIEELILSRGRDLFDPKKEKRVKLNWQ